MTTLITQKSNTYFKNNPQDFHGKKPCGFILQILLNDPFTFFQEHQFPIGSFLIL